MKSKYIIIRHKGVEVPLVFSRQLAHEDMVASGEAISAGFCEMDDAGQWVVDGMSFSLNLTARQQDAEILKAHL